MESKLLSSPPTDRPAEAVRPEQESAPAADALAEVRKVIEADTRDASEKYLEEVRVAVSGE